MTWGGVSPCVPLIELVQWKQNLHVYHPLIDGASPFVLCGGCYLYDSCGLMQHVHERIHWEKSRECECWWTRKHACTCHWWYVMMLLTLCRFQQQSLIGIACVVTSAATLVCIPYLVSSFFRCCPKKFTIKSATLSLYVMFFFVTLSGESD